MAAAAPDLCLSCLLDRHEDGETIPVVGRCERCNHKTTECGPDCPCEVARRRWRAPERAVTHGDYRDRQRADWAFGNAAMSNPDVTREMAERAVQAHPMTARRPDPDLCPPPDVLREIVEAGDAYDGARGSLETVRAAYHRLEELATEHGPEIARALLAAQPALDRMRVALGMIPEATTDQVAQAVECEAADRRRLHEGLLAAQDRIRALEAAAGEVVDRDGAPGRIEALRRALAGEG
jgi:hypothetical protein